MNISVETNVYRFIFISSILYSFVKFYQTSNVYLNEIHKNDLRSDKWLSRNIFNRPVDVADLEWQVIKQFCLDNKILFFLFHLIGFQITRRLFPNYVQLFIISYSTFTLGYLLTIKYLILIYLNIGFVLLLEFLQDFLQKQFRKFLNYLFFVYSITVIHKLDFVADREQNLLIHISFSWLNAKLLSCSIDSYDDDNYLKKPNLFHYISIRLAYLLYFPPFFFGPIYQFSDFEKSIKHLDWNSDKNLIKNFLHLIKFILWALFLEIILHFVYSSTFQYYIYLTVNFDTWSLCGFGYSLMIIFFVKYFIVYGISRQLSIIDGLDNVIAKPPECIAHIHQTWYLWRKFDQGLYAFLIKYFYKPLTGSHYDSIPRRLSAALVCFTIIALWHGYYDAIIVWVAMNIMLSYFELIGSIIVKSKHFKNKHRIKALGGSPLLALAYISNIFFLSNYEIGMLFVTNILFGSPIPLLLLLFIFYCGCFVCKQINERIK